MDALSLAVADSPLGETAGPSGDRLTRRRASTGSVAMPSEENEGPSASKARLKESQSALEDAASMAFETLMKRLEPAAEALGEEAFDELQDKLRSGFDHFVRQAGERLSTLSEDEMNSTRKQLKTQQNMFALKLETARKAASVSMKNQKAENLAAAEREFTRKVSRNQ